MKRANKKNAARRDSFRDLIDKIAAWIATDTIYC